MRVLVTGANGFMGTHLVRALLGMADINVSTYVRGDEPSSLYEKLIESDFIFHLAGVNRPKNKDDFLSSNVQLTADIVNILYKNKIKSPVYFSSSIHASVTTEYGSSKLACELLLSNLERENGNRILVDRLTRIVGPGARPDYNSVVATFCYRIVNSLFVSISDRDTLIEIAFVDDWVKRCISILKSSDDVFELTCYKTTLGNLYDMLMSFKKNKDFHLLPGKTRFEEYLYQTYLFYENVSKS